MTEYKNCKIDSGRRKYGLENLDERIITKRERDDLSLRDLETYVNLQILKRAMRWAGMTVVDGQGENYYRLLTSEEIPDSSRQIAKRELESEGVDVDEVTDDFITYQTVRKHLNDCLEIDTSEEVGIDLEKEQKSVGSLEGRVKAIINRIVERIKLHDKTTIGDYSVMVSINIRCEDCGRIQNFYRFLQEPTCDCDPSGMRDFQDAPP